MPKATRKEHREKMYLRRLKQLQMVNTKTPAYALSFRTSIAKHYYKKELRHAKGFRT